MPLYARINKKDLKKEAKYTITKTQLNFEFSKLFNEPINIDDVIELLANYKLAKKDGDSIISDVPLNKLVDEFKNSGLLDILNKFRKR